MDNKLNRRPLKAREWGIIRKSARWLSHKDVTPNHISIASIGFSVFATLCLIALPAGDTMTWVLSWLALLFILCRALCNIFDGMVAVEGGKSTASGELFNDIPDRISDPLIIVAAGYATEIVTWAPALGWCAGLLAVMTAYVRTLARGLGAPSDFRGPMAKTHRMAVIAIACILTPFWPQGYIFFIALIVIAVGCIVTIWNRARAAYLFLEGKAHV